MCDMNAAAGAKGAPAFKGVCGIPGDSEEAPVPTSLAKFFFNAAIASQASAVSDRKTLRNSDIPEDICLSPSSPPPKG